MTLGFWSQVAGWALHHVLTQAQAFALTAALSIVRSILFVGVADKAKVSEAQHRNFLAMWVSSERMRQSPWFCGILAESSHIMTY